MQTQEHPHNPNYKCPKCGTKEYQLGQMRAVGGFWSKFFNIQNRRFVTVTCTQCKYTEMYEGTKSTLENVLDFFGN